MSGVGSHDSEVRVYWAYLWVPVAALLLMGFASNARGPLFPDILEGLALSDSWGGLMFSATCAGTLLGSVGFRKLLESWSTLRALQLAVAFAWVGLMGVSFAWEGVSLLSASAVFGVGSGGATLCQNLMIDQGSEPSQRRRWYAGLHSAYGLASLLAPFAVVSLSHLDLPWMVVLRVVCIPLVLFAVGLFPIRPLERSKAEPAPTERFRMDASAWTIAFLIGMAVSAELVISTRLVLHCERLGLSDVAAASMLSLFFAALLLSRLSLSLFNFRMSNRRLVVICLLGATVFAGLGLSVHPALLALVALPLGPFFPAMMDLISEEHGEHAASIMSLIIVVVASLLAIVHALVGVLSDLFSLHVALGICPLLLVASLLLFRRYRRLAAA